MKAKLVSYFSESCKTETKIYYDCVFLIDVYRATSSMVVMTNSGANSIKTVSSLEDAYGEKEKNGDYILCGERNCNIPEGFDYGNDTSLLSQVDFKGKTCVMTTSNGTRALDGFANNSKVFYACSVLNINACLEHIKKSLYQHILILCAGNDGTFSMEDYICGALLLEGIKDLLEDKNDEIKLSVQLGAFYKNNPDHLKRALKNTDHALRLKSQNKYDDVCFIVKHIDAYGCLPKLG